MSALHSLKLENLVCGVGNQLRYVDRFSTCRRTHKENVAEHQFYTAFFTLMICMHLSDEISIGEAVIRALIHDVEEHSTGDVIRPVKHGSKETEQALNAAGETFCKNFFLALTCDTKLAQSLYGTWKDAKDKSKEGRIVKFADFLSVIAYLHQEVRSGNKLVMDNVNQLSEYVSTFDSDEFDFLRPLVKEARAMVDLLDKAVRL